MSLIINDEYVKNKVAKYSVEHTEILAEVISKYVDILDNVIAQGIKKGKTSAALKEFKNQVESSTGKNSSGAELIGNEAKWYCENFITRVDKDDKDLY